MKQNIPMYTPFKNIDEREILNKPIKERFIKNDRQK
jgi:hypothetical protein